MADQQLRRLERDQAGWREQLAAGRRAGKWALAQCAAGRFALEGQRIKPEYLVDHDLAQAWVFDLPGARRVARDRNPRWGADANWSVLWLAGLDQSSRGARLHEESLMILDPAGAAVAVSIESCLGPARAWDSTEGGHRLCRLVGHAIDGFRSEAKIWGGACGGFNPAMPAMQGHHYDKPLQGCNGPFGSLCWTELKRLHKLVMELGRLPNRKEYTDAAKKEPKGAQARRP